MLKQYNSDCSLLASQYWHLLLNFLPIFLLILRASFEILMTATPTARNISEVCKLLEVRFRQPAPMVAHYLLYDGKRNAE